MVSEAQAAPKLVQPRPQPAGRGDAGSARLPRALVVRVPLAPVAESPETRDAGLGACPRCGSKGFNVHQRTAKAVKDPQVRRVEVVRHLCKRCGYVRRVYPTGVGPGRQTAALKQVSVLLWRAGLSLETVGSLLAGLGCRLSASAIRSNVAALRQALPAEALQETQLEHLRLKPAGGGRLSGPDGRIDVRLVGTTPLQRWLEVEIAPGPGAAYLRWRWQAGARWVAAAMRRLGWPLGFPPGTA